MSLSTSIPKVVQWKIPCAYEYFRPVLIMCTVAGSHHLCAKLWDHNPRWRDLILSELCFPRWVLTATRKFSRVFGTVIASWQMPCSRRRVSLHNHGPDVVARAGLAQQNTLLHLSSFFLHTFFLRSRLLDWFSQMCRHHSVCCTPCRVRKLPRIGAANMCSPYVPYN